MLNKDPEVSWDSSLEPKFIKIPILTLDGLDEDSVKILTPFDSVED